MDDVPETGKHQYLTFNPRDEEQVLIDAVYARIADHELSDDHVLCIFAGDESIECTVAEFVAAFPPEKSK